MALPVDDIATPALAQWWRKTANFSLFDKNGHRCLIALPGCQAELKYQTLIERNRTMTVTILVLATILVALIAWAFALRIVNEYVEDVTVWDYQAGLHYKDGRYLETLEAGKHRLLGKGHSVILFDMRLTELVVQGQELITSDSATVKLTAVAQWKITDPLQFHKAASDVRQAVYTRIQLALRKLVGGLTLDEVVEQKAQFGPALLDEVRQPAANDFGIEVACVDVRDVMLGGELKSVYTSVLTARKEAQAKQERARGDAAALRTMANAAKAFENNPELFRLRYLETLKEAGAGYGNQLIIGVPEELMGLVKKS